MLIRTPKLTTSVDTEEWFDALKSVPMIHHGHFQNVLKCNFLGKMAILEMTKMYAGTDFSASNHLGGPQRWQL